MKLKESGKEAKARLLGRTDSCFLLGGTEPIFQFCSLSPICDVLFAVVS